MTRAFESSYGSSALIKTALFANGTLNRSPTFSRQMGEVPVTVVVNIGTNRFVELRLITNHVLNVGNESRYGLFGEIREPVLMVTCSRIASITFTCLFNSFSLSSSRMESYFQMRFIGTIGDDRLLT